MTCLFLLWHFIDGIGISSMVFSFGENVSPALRIAISVVESHNEKLSLNISIDWGVWISCRVLLNWSKMSFLHLEICFTRARELSSCETATASPIARVIQCEIILILRHPLAHLFTLLIMTRRFYISSIFLSINSRSVYRACLNTRLGFFHSTLELINDTCPRKKTLANCNFDW